jgi:YD repeat-containing protein
LDEYDAVGNMTKRYAAGIPYNLGYDAENRLVSYSGGSGAGAISATFTYDGDGNRVKGVVTLGGVTITTTFYVGAHYEVEGTTSPIIRKYYAAGGQRVAIRENGTLSYLLSDHLGSTSITLNEAGTARTGLVQYSSWGETRYSEGTTPTKRRYTGQYEEANLGIYYYGARWHDLREDGSSARIR